MTATLWIWSPFAVEAAAIGGAWLLARAGERADMRAETRRRSESPSGAANGTGDERESPSFREAAPSDVDSAPRSPMAPMGGAADPRPSVSLVGLDRPGGVVGPRPATPPGIQRQRVILHG